MQIQYVELMVTAKDRVQICDTVCWFCKKFVTQFCWFCNEDNELLLMYLLQCGLWFCLANIQYICLVDLKTTSLTKKKTQEVKNHCQINLDIYVNTYPATAKAGAAPPS